MEMDYVQYFRSLKPDKCVCSLVSGYPGPATLKNCKELLLQATSIVLDQEADLISTFSYGQEPGDEEFRKELASFLSKQYGDEVKSSNLMVTAGATQGLHLLATVLFNQHSIVFHENPSYFLSYNVLKKDLGIEVVPVNCDDNGMNMEELDHLLTIHRPADFKASTRRPFWGFVYTVPVFNNPTGRSYTPDRCRMLVQLARRHDVLIFADDIYNLIHFGEDGFPPPRLFSYDCPSDSDYQGHVVSNSTFSKILAPGFRLGWMEASERILQQLHGSYLAWSGGAFNHYASRLATALLKLDFETKHLIPLRKIYGSRNDAICQVLRENLPAEVTFTKPKGGFFVWLQFPKEVDTFKMMEYITKEYKVTFLPGVCCFLRQDYKNCVRLSFSFYEQDILIAAAKLFVDGAIEFMKRYKSVDLS